MEITILTPMELLRQQMLIIETAGRTCYQSYKGEPTKESARKFCAMILKRGHESVIEHSVMTVRSMVDNVSLVSYIGLWIIGHENTI